MARWQADGRTQAPQMVALLGRSADGHVQLRSPGVGLWRGAPAPGSLIVGNSPLGELEVLGVLHNLCAPEGARGLVLPGEASGHRAARIAVGYGDVLCTLDPEAGVGMVNAGEDDAVAGASGLVFRAPSAGRLYTRASPDKPAFVKPGDTVTAGQTVALLEIMKTFNRITYGGPGLPDPATVSRLLHDDGADVEEGDPLFELEPG